MSAQRVAFRADELLRQLAGDAPAPTSRPHRCGDCLGSVEPIKGDTGLRYWPATCERCAERARKDRDRAKAQEQHELGQLEATKRDAAKGGFKR